ncbi:MAG: transglutaminase family protein [Planctomycetota bacterium]
MTLDLTLIDPPMTSAARPLRAGRTVRVQVSGHAGRPLRVWLITPLNRIAWTRRTTPPGTGPIAVEFELAPDTPSGALRLMVTADLRRAHMHTPQAVLRLPFEGRAPWRPVWRYRQRISARADGRGLQQLRVSALVPRAIPLKLWVHPPLPPPDPGSPASTDDLYGNRWQHATLDARELDAAGVMPEGTGEAGPKRARPIVSREIDLVSFSLSASDVALDADLRMARLAGELATLPAHFQRYLQPEPHIESDAPEVLELAASVPDASADGGPIATARGAWKVVRSHMRYVLQRDEHGALYAAQRGVGDCTEYAALFVALCRARGLPARVAAGCFGDEPVPAHAVAEIWLNGVWFGLDPTNHAGFCIGLPAAFVPMMRANWMTAERAYQPWTATFLTRDREPPHLVFSEKFARTDELLPPPVPPFRLVGAPAPAVAPLPDVGGDWIASQRVRPDVSMELAGGGLRVMIRNGTEAAWRLQVIAAVEPDAPLVFAVREVLVASGESRDVLLPHPRDVADLVGTLGVMVAVLAGEQLIAIERR